MVTTWLIAFALTQIIEAPIYATALRGIDRERKRSSQRGSANRLLLGLLPSTLTHPVVWFVFPQLMRAPIEFSYVMMVVCAEAFALVAEFLILRRLGLSHAMLWSLLANALSLGLGLVLRHHTGLV